MTITDATTPNSQLAPATFTVEASLQHAFLRHAEVQTTSCLVSIKAPEAPEKQRANLDVVAVVDRSGSMHGEKMRLMNKSLEFMVKFGLQPSDTLSIVAYDHNVETRLAPTKMNAQGKQTALEAIQRIHSGGQTNLSGGLVKGIDLLNQLEDKKTAQQQDRSKNTRAVLLFTDGLANVGISNHEGVLNAMAGALKQAPECSVFSFGFGKDHNEDMLRGIADEAHGLYYFIETPEMIAQAYADCLGGLCSVVAQNVSIELHGGDGVAVQRVLGPYKSSVDAEKTRCTVEISDLYSEDEKDIVLELTLPKMEAPGSNSVTATVKLFNVVTNQPTTLTASAQLGRPASTPAEQPVNLALDAQRNRLLSAEAMQRATALADKGSLTEGRELLSKQLEALRCSPSAPQCGPLMEELQKTRDGFVDMEEYHKKGAKYGKMCAQSNMQQRSTHAAGAMYAKKSKMGMRSEWSKAMAVEEANQQQQQVPQMQQQMQQQMQTSQLGGKMKAGKMKAGMMRIPQQLPNVD